MRVHWIVTNYPHRAEPQAGIFYKHLAEALVKKGIDLTVIAPLPMVPFPLSILSPRWNKYKEAPEYEVINEVKIYRPRYLTVPRESHFRFPAQSMVNSYYQLQLPKADIIHGFGGYHTGLAAGIIARQIQIKCAQTFIGSEINSAINGDKNALSFLKEIQLRTDRFIGVSADLCNKIKQLTNQHAHVIYMPVHFRKSQEKSRDELRKKFNLPAESFLVLFAGYLYESKGALVVIEAAQALDKEPDIEFIFCGGASELVKKIESGINMRYLGQQEQQTLLEIMQCADVLALPSYNEGIPGVIKEAGMSMLPVIATGVGGIPEVIDETNGYLISPGNADALARTILAVRDNPEGATQKSTLLKAKIADMFDSDKIADQQTSLYKNLLNE